jgi:hypothetical protein
MTDARTTRYDPIVVSAESAVTLLTASDSR